MWLLFWKGMKEKPHVCHRVNRGTSDICLQPLLSDVHPCCEATFTVFQVHPLHFCTMFCDWVTVAVWYFCFKNHSYVIIYAFVFCTEYESHSTLCCFLYLTVLNVDFIYYHQFHGMQLHHTCNQHLAGHFSCMLHILFCHHIYKVGDYLHS